ncbi:AlpA family phage regulatory protein [Luteimonas gilva]|uniref:AlpA family phage regulatory protein n=1 Tax=Luteimonas gilva TaxID=2572684 RepID=A0A4U5K0M8_9GAMM|nr:AlpA family phage regulatory protein [Luteimonas gilva]
MQNKEVNEGFRNSTAQPYLRAAQAAARYGIARSTFWLYVKEGKLPQPIRFGPRIRVWKVEEIDRAFEEFSGKGVGVSELTSSRRESPQRSTRRRAGRQSAAVAEL